MNKIIPRFIIVKKQKTLEVIFNGRLTMEENFKLLSEIYEIGSIEKTYVVDINRKVALKKNIPISSFNFKNFKTLYLF